MPDVTHLAEALQRGGQIVGLATMPYMGTMPADCLRIVATRAVQVVLPLTCSMSSFMANPSMHGGGLA